MSAGRRLLQVSVGSRVVGSHLEVAHRKEMARAALAAEEEADVASDRTQRGDPLRVCARL